MRTTLKFDQSCKTTTTMQPAGRALTQVEAFERRRQHSGRWRQQGFLSPEQGAQTVNCVTLYSLIASMAPRTRAHSCRSCKSAGPLGPGCKCRHSQAACTASHCALQS